MQTKIFKTLFFVFNAIFLDHATQSSAPPKSIKGAIEIAQKRYNSYLQSNKNIPGPTFFYRYDPKFKIIFDETIKDQHVPHIEFYRCKFKGVAFEKCTLQNVFFIIDKNKTEHSISFTDCDLNNVQFVLRTQSLRFFELDFNKCQLNNCKFISEKNKSKLLIRYKNSSLKGVGFVDILFVKGSSIKSKKDKGSNEIDSSSFQSDCKYGVS